MVGDSSSTAAWPCLEVVPCVCVLPPNIAINTPSNATSSRKMALIQRCQAPKNSEMTDISPIRTRKIAYLKNITLFFYLRPKKLFKASLIAVTLITLIRLLSCMY